MKRRGVKEMRLLPNVGPQYPGVGWGARKVRASLSPCVFPSCLVQHPSDHPRQCQVLSLVRGLSEVILKSSHDSALYLHFPSAPQVRGAQSEASDWLRLFRSQTESWPTESVSSYPTTPTLFLFVAPFLFFPLTFPQLCHWSSPALDYKLDYCSLCL